MQRTQARTACGAGLSMVMGSLPLWQLPTRSATWEGPPDIIWMKAIILAPLDRDEPLAIWDQTLIDSQANGSISTYARRPKLSKSRRGGNGEIDTLVRKVSKATKDLTMDRTRRNAKIVKLLRARELTMDEIGDKFGLSRGAIALIAKAHGASPGIRGSTRKRFIRPSA
jgi:hypothetical protein